MSKNIEDGKDKENANMIVNTTVDEKTVDVQYQTVTVRKKTENSATSSINHVEEILKRIVPAKSFLYRYQTEKSEEKVEKPVTSYMPMNAASVRKPKKFFRFSYDYPNLDLKHFRFSRTENFNDNGYYCVKTNNEGEIQRNINFIDGKLKYKSLQTPDEMEKITEDHFYEDLNYTEVDKDCDDLKEESQNNPRQYKSLLQELLNSFKLPFFKKPKAAIETIETEETKTTAKFNKDDNNKHIYENSDIIGNMYDSVQVKEENRAAATEKQPSIPVEDYLEPKQVIRDYCDVEFKQKDDSIFGYIMSLFENRFGTKRETNDVHQSEDFQDIEEPSEEVKNDEKSPKTNMADRPLPVPIENEPYYMNIERNEAENLLRGTPNGTFILRPSSQPDHAYTLSVSCSNAVHNVGVRRRSDGRLALGFARKGEKAYNCVTSLLRYHRKQRLLLITPNGLCATTLNESPQYYQTPCSLPIANV